MFLSLEPEIVSIFGFTDCDANNIAYVNWLSMAYAGLIGLELYDPERGWLQAHMQVHIFVLNHLKKIFFTYVYSELFYLFLINYS